MPKRTHKPIVLPDAQVPLLDVGQAALYLGISRAYLYMLVGRGSLVTKKLGKRTMFRRADLDAFAAAK
jgi:excisionase family DNA binding protein